MKCLLLRKDGITNVLLQYVGPNILNLPAVLYYKKGDKKHGISGKTKHNTKHAGKGKRIQRRSEDDGDRRDVVFLSKPYDYAPKPTTLPPTTSYNVFDYKGNYRNWLFLFPDKHPVNLRYVDQGKANDPNQQQADASQDAAATGAPVAAGGVAAPAVAPASPAVAQPAAPAFASPAAAPSVPQVAQPTAAVAQPWNAVQTALTNQTQNKTIELINQSVSLASNDTQPPQASYTPPVANVASTQGYGAQNSTAPTGSELIDSILIRSLDRHTTHLTKTHPSGRAHFCFHCHERLFNLGRTTFDDDVHENTTRAFREPHTYPSHLNTFLSCSCFDNGMSSYRPLYISCYAFT